MSKGDALESRSPEIAQAKGVTPSNLFENGGVVVRHTSLTWESLVLTCLAARYRAREGE